MPQIPRFATVTAEHVVHLAEVAAYRPDAFHERELPAIAALVNGHHLDLLVVDGYVTLTRPAAQASASTSTMNCAYR